MNILILYFKLSIIGKKNSTRPCGSMVELQSSKLKVAGSSPVRVIFIFYQSNTCITKLDCTNLFFTGLYNTSFIK